MTILCWTHWLVYGLRFGLMQSFKTIANLYYWRLGITLIGALPEPTMRSKYLEVGCEIPSPVLEFSPKSLLYTPSHGCLKILTWGRAKSHVMSIIWYLIVTFFEWSVIGPLSLPHIHAQRGKVISHVCLSVCLSVRDWMPVLQIQTVRPSNCAKTFKNCLVCASFC